MFTPTPATDNSVSAVGVAGDSATLEAVADSDVLGNDVAAV
ncbi:hypothetical protein [Gordonia humi]|uniref:Uncharacterized protein n=1 Tax=Gordonia humi TaxID=686429 RepID=A0A840EYC3_9ACTN|nr:hypothetical protein [Gordonia humi]MBB4133979.1 hypothetical protein [Gordonia humi]